MTFKEKLVKLRKLKGITQDEFASAVGVSRQAVYKWESGQSYPEVAKLLEIKFLFDISIDDLLDENYEVILPEKKKRRRLSKEVKAQIEAQVAKEESGATTTVMTEVVEKIVAAPKVEAAPAPKAEPKAAPAPKAEPKAAPAPKAEPKPAPAPKAASAPKAEPKPAPAPKAEPAKETIDGTQRKNSFFSKFFGNK